MCYRTPTEIVYGQLKDLIQEVSSRDFIPMGDFNYKGIDWTNNCCDTSSVEDKLFLERVNKCGNSTWTIQCSISYLAEIQIYFTMFWLMVIFILVIISS